MSIRSIIMAIRPVFTAPAQPLRWPYRYGMLVFLLVLITRELLWLSNLPADWAFDRYAGIVLDVTMLLFLLGWQFVWPKYITLVLRILALGMTVFGCVYIF